MALSVLKRPYGFNRTTFNTTGASDFILADGSGKATVSLSGAHGLTTNQVVYMITPIKQYNGFKYVEVISATQFQLKEYPTAATISNIKTVRGPDFSYWTCNNNSTTNGLHNWNAVHLPIIYKLSSTLWPTNSADTARTVSSFTNDNGYVNLNLSGDIKATGSANELEWVKISGSNGLDGIYQILVWYSDTDITINLEYSAGYSFTGGTVQYYYNNYHAIIRIYGGLSTSHYWTGQKPYELLAEKKVVPDSSGVITVNISDELKNKLEILSNNIQLGTLPNNIDAFCMFYITYAESYDDSNGYTLGSATSSYTSDQANFEGYAVNADLPFKNVHAGSLSEYASNDSAQKFLTSFPEPSIFQNKYFDLSFILINPNMLYFIKQAYYLNGALQTSTTTAIDEFEEGVYRYQIDNPSCSYDSVRANILKNLLPTLSSFTNVNTGDEAWTTGSNPSVAVVGAGTSDELSGTLIGPSESGVYTVKYDIDVTLVTAVSEIYFRFYKAGVNKGENFFESSLGSNTGTLNVTVTDVPDTMVVYVVSTAGNITLDINSLNISNRYSTSPATETKTIKIDCECYSEYIYLSWLNPFGGYDYWLFTGAKEVGTDIINKQQGRKDLISEYPNSYGEYADTVNYETSRDSKRTYLVRSQPLTKEQALAISEIKSSPLVQIISDSNGWDRRTVILDEESFVILDEQDKLHILSFTIYFTDDQPSQSL